MFFYNTEKYHHTFRAPDCGSWMSPSPQPGRYRLPVFRSALFPRGATCYRVTFDAELMNAVATLDYSFLANVKGLDKMSRFRLAVPRWFPLRTTSFGSPLYLYHTLLRKAGQPSIAQTLLGYFNKINRRLYNFVQKDGNNACLCDDFVRKHLALLSKWAFPKVFTDGPAYQLLWGLEMVGGPAPWTKAQILKKYRIEVSKVGLIIVS